MASTTLGDVKTNSKVSFVDNIPESNVTPSSANDLATKNYVDNAYTGTTNQVAISSGVISLTDALHIGTSTNNNHATSSVSSTLYFGDTDVGGTGGFNTKSKCILIGDGAEKFDGKVDRSIIRLSDIDMPANSEFVGTFLLFDGGGVGSHNGAYLDFSIANLSGTVLGAAGDINGCLINLPFDASSSQLNNICYQSFIHSTNASFNRRYYNCGIVSSSGGDTGIGTDTNINSFAFGQFPELRGNNVTLICGGTGVSNGYFYSGQSSRYTMSQPGLGLASGKIYIGGGTGTNFVTEFVDRRPQCSETSLPTTNTNDLVSKSYVDGLVQPLYLNSYTAVDSIGGAYIGAMGNTGAEYGASYIVGRTGTYTTIIAGVQDSSLAGADSYRFDINVNSSTIDQVFITSSDPNTKSFSINVPVTAGDLISVAGLANAATAPSQIMKATLY